MINVTIFKIEKLKLQPTRPVEIFSRLVGFFVCTWAEIVVYFKFMEHALFVEQKGEPRHGQRQKRWPFFFILADPAARENRVRTVPAARQKTGLSQRKQATQWAAEPSKV